MTYRNWISITKTPKRWKKLQLAYKDHNCKATWPSFPMLNIDGVWRNYVEESCACKMTFQETLAADQFWKLLFKDSLNQGVRKFTLIKEDTFGERVSSQADKKSWWSLDF